MPRDRTGKDAPATREWRRRILRQRLTGDIAQVASQRGVEVAADGTDLDACAIALLEAIRGALAVGDARKLEAMAQAAVKNDPNYWSPGLEALLKVLRRSTRRPSPSSNVADLNTWRESRRRDGE